MIHYFQEINHFEENDMPAKCNWTISHSILDDPTLHTEVLITIEVFLRMYTPHDKIVNSCVSSFV